MRPYRSQPGNADRHRALVRLTLAFITAATALLVLPAIGEAAVGRLEAPSGQARETAPVSRVTSASRRADGGGVPPCFPGVITNTAPPSISPTSGGVPIYVFTSDGNWSPCQATIDHFEYAWYVNGNLASTGASWYSVTSPGVPVWSSVRACSDEYGCSAWANSNVGTYQASCSPGPPWNINAPIISPTSGSVPITVSTNTGGWATCPEAEVTSYNVLWYVNGSAVASNVFSYTVTTPNVGVFSSVQACDNFSRCSAWVNSNTAVYAPPANRPPIVSIVKPGNAYSGPDSYWTSLDDAHTGPFQAAYSDPDGDTGTVGCTLFRYDELQGWLTDQSATVSNVASGSTPSCSFPLAIETGDWAWTAWANDGHSAAVSTPLHYFHVNWRPNKPTLESPKVAGGGTVDVPTTTPVLSATGSDHEADTLGYRFFVSTTDATNCPLPGGATVDSGYLGATDTFTVPSGALKDGCTYSWSVRTTDFWDRDDETSSESPQSDSGLFRVKVPKLGLRDYWPMWSRGPVAVNEATGNLVLAVPGPSYPTAAGSLGASLAYNLLDTRVSAFPSPAGSWTLGLADVPARLIDHDLLPINSTDRFDAVEVVEADGSSTYYTRVGNSDTYQSPPGDTSVLARRPAGGFLLTGPDGSSYDFGAGDSNNGGVAPLLSATVSSNLGQTKLTYAFAGGKVQSVTASGKDGSGNYQTFGALQYKWAGDPACTDALLCIVGPDNVRWRYIGDGPSGTSGKLTTVSDGFRNVLQLGYDAANRPATLRNANDLDPSNASPGYSAAHQLQIGYDASGRVANVTESQVRNRFFNLTGGSDPFARRDLVWGFAYSCAGAVLHAPTQAHAPAQSASAGCTELTLPKGQKTQVFYDRLAHPLESRDPLGNYTLTQYDDRDQLAWSEDPLHNPTDYTYDAFSFLPTSVTGPDPDTPAGLLPRTLTGYFYDETKPGDGNSAGAALQGLQASYFDTPDLTGAQGGTPVKQRNDPNVDSVANWGGGGPPALGGRTTNFSVRWTGILNVAAQTSKVFATVADGGTRLTIDGTVAIDKWTGQTTAQPSCSGQPIPLTAGKHRIMLEYRETTGTPKVQLEWGAACTSLTIVASSDLQPGWFNRTSTVGYGTGNGDTKRVGFSHFAAPESRQPDYSLADATGARLITSFGYDGYGRITSKVMPKGNAARNITAGGDLTGAITPGFDTTYTYYPAGAQASSAACGTPSANQAGLPQTTTVSGVAPVTNVYDAAGRPVAITNGAGTGCRTYDAEGRLIADKAPGESQQTTYAYDPAGLLRTSTDAGGAVTNVYDESGAIIDVTDSYGAESELAHDADGNLTLRRVAVGPLAASTVYTTTNSFDTADRLIQTDDPAARRFTFSYDARGALKGTQYPNGTFSWNNYVPTGWLAGTYNQHGTAPSPTGTPPADANALSDFVYYYFADGRRSRETRTGGTFADEVTSYAYDGVGRLALVWGALSRTYCYDLDSNRTALYLAVTTCGLGTADASYSYPPGQGVDQLQSVAKSGVTTAYAYKPDGQVSARGGDTFTWDGRGRLAGGSFPSFSGTQFRVDGNSVGGPVAGGSPTRQLDTTTLANGWHTIGATASDRNGKQGAAPSRVINVQNGAQPASQIQFVKQLGPATTTAAASTVTLAVPATGVGAGQTLIVLAGKAGTKVTAVSDSKANTYAADRSSIANGATNVAVYSGRVTSALTSSDTITVTFGSATANPAVAFALEFSGIAAPPSKTDEVGAGKTGSGTALITSTTNATDHPVELVVAGFGASVSSAFTAASGYTKATSGSTAVGTATLAVHGAWRVTTQQGPQSTSGTLATSGKWASGIVTYRAADLAAPTQPGALTASNAPGTTALAWTASSDSSGVAYYHVHRSTSSNFTPGTTNEIGQTTLTSYTDNGDGTTNGLAGGTYYYKVIAEDGVGNRSAASAQAASTVTADTGLPKVALTAPTAGSQQTGTSTLAATASDPTPAHALSYGFDAAGFRRSRTLDGVTTRHLLGGLIETTSGGTITVFDVDGPAGDLIHYDGPPTTATPTYLYYSGHGDLAAQLVGTQTTPTAANVLRYDPFGEPINAPFGSNQTELFTGGWDKKFDPVSDLVEMGARPYDANLGRFYEVDPVDGGSLNGYEYAGQDPINGYDLDGRQFACAPCDGGAGAWLEHQFTGTPPLVLKIEMTLKTPMGAVVLGLMVGKGGKAYYYGWDPLGRGAVSLSGAATLEDGTVESGNHIELSGTFCFRFVCQGFDTHHHSSLGIRLPGRGEPFEASLKITRVRKF